MSNFTVDLENFGERAMENAERIVRKIGFDLHARIVKRMPVDTGRAKANTQISLNSVPSSSISATDTTESSPIADAGQISAASTARAENAISAHKLGDAIYIYNNVEYIGVLEFGSHSEQAPNGMFRISVAEIAQHLGGVGS